MQIDSLTSASAPAPLQAYFPDVRPFDPHAAQAAGRGGRPADPAMDLAIGQLLCARLCHDLIGPTAAINAGEELLREGCGDDADTEDTHELVAESARQLAGRLAFFRIAFGQGGSIRAGLSYAEMRSLAEGFMLGGRVRLDWRPDPGDLFGEGALPADQARLVLCLIMLATDALPRGGQVGVRVESDAGQVRLTLDAEGKAARLAPDLRDALGATDATDVASVTARTVHAFYLSRLAARLRVPLELDAGRPGCVRIAAVIPPTFVERRRG